MTTTQIADVPQKAQDLIDFLAQLDAKMDEAEIVLRSAERGPMGNTLDSAKTPEWHAAKQLHFNCLALYRETNAKLNKMRKVVGYKAVDGKRVAIYQYK